MKVFAQSLVPTRIPYIHLGYLAATATRPHPTLLGSSLVLLVVGAWLALKVAIGKTKGGYTAFHVRLRKGVVHVAVGAVLLVFAFGGLALAYAKAKLAYRRPVTMTRIHMYVIERDIGQLLEQGKSVPEDPRLLVTDTSEYRLQDGWFHAMRLERTEREGRTLYAVVSAGPDGEFGTDDDLRSKGVSSGPQEPAGEPAGAGTSGG